MAFSRALYYPWQDMEDDAWLKTALLLLGIKSVRYAPRDDGRPYKSLVSEEFWEAGILQPVMPDIWSAANAAQKF